MLEAAFWGLIQGATEFLPISSSGHLVLVPAVMGNEGPDLATSAVLHLGTLLAVLLYFRSDVAEMIRLSPEGKRLLRLVVLGTIPAVILGLIFRGSLETLNDNPEYVAVALFLTGVLLLSTRYVKTGRKDIDEAGDRDAAIVGVAQAAALIPGVSRSGMTISAGLTRELRAGQAARYSFLLGIPTIAGAGLLQFFELSQESGGITAETWVGMGVAAISGYLAIALLLRLIRTVGLAPFGIYCMAFGAVAFFVV